MTSTDHRVSTEYLSAEQLEERVPWTLNTIRKKTSRREIPFLKKGRRVIYDWRRITEWLQEGAVEPTKL